jgi:hypothetical protein
MRPCTPWSGDAGRVSFECHANEGHWRQTGVVIMFNPTNPKKTRRRRMRHHGKVFLAITFVDAVSRIVIPAADTKKDQPAGYAVFTW